MRIKINDKIYRLKEIESGVDSLMELVEEPKYKDGDFVYEDGRIIIVKSYPNNYHCMYYPHIGGPFFDNRYGIDFTAKSFRRTTEDEKQVLLDALTKKGKRWNAEKLCIEDIPKFKKGDKVRIKDGISSNTHTYIRPFFTNTMDELIGEVLTVEYCDSSEYVICDGYSFLKEWLEPYVEELKKGDLAIFWDSEFSEARIGVYNKFYEGLPFPHIDHIGNSFRNAVKFESTEQFEKLINGEI